MERRGVVWRSPKMLVEIAIYQKGQFVNSHLGGTGWYETHTCANDSGLE